jgi:hypothetical protein
MSTPAFSVNAYYENLIELRATKRAAFDSMSPATMFALAYYETAKQEHEHEQIATKQRQEKRQP